MRTIDIFKNDPLIERKQDKELNKLSPTKGDQRYILLDLQEEGRFYVMERGTSPDLFYYHYIFHREFQEEDYQRAKKDFDNVLIGFHYTSIGAMARNQYWGHGSADDIHRISFEKIRYKKPEIVDYNRTTLKNLPKFLLETDCRFLILEDHEITDPALSFHILGAIHSFCEEYQINPSRFIHIDNSLKEPDDRTSLFYKKNPRYKTQVRFMGLPRFESQTSFFYSGSLGSGGGDFDISPYQGKRSKKFIFLNRRGRPHRTAMMVWLYQKNLLEYFHYSWGEREGHFDNWVYDNLRPDFPSKEALKVNQEIFQGAPFILDIDLNLYDESGPPHFGPGSDYKGILRFVKDSYLNLVSETDISPFYTFLTEKTFKPIVWRQPFIIWGNAHSLFHLQERGYKTFSSWIDESYDEIENRRERFLALTEEIERWCQKGEKEVYHLTRKMEPILEHNFQHFSYLSVLPRNHKEMIDKLDESQSSGRTLQYSNR